MNDVRGRAPAASGQNLKGIIAGAIAGVAEIITYPPEYVKIQLQLDENEGLKKYDGVMDCVKKTVKSQGVCGLYTGVSVLLYGSVPKTGVRFGTFETVKKYLVNEDGLLSGAETLLCGLIAGIAEAVFTVTPIETIKVKFIHDMRRPQPRFKGFCHGVWLIVKEEGVCGAYRGVVPTVIKQGSNQAIRFFVVESLRELYKGGDPTKYVPVYWNAIFGSFAGAASVLANNPIDVVKTRMQGLETDKYKNTCDCILKMWKNESFFAFYKGTVPRLCRVIIYVPIIFLIYDWLMDLLNDLWP